MIGMRSFTLKARAEATEAVVKKNLPDRFSTVVESRILTESRGTQYYRYASISPGAKNKWKPNSGQVIDAHVNIQNPEGETVAQVVVEPFLPFTNGRPTVSFGVKKEPWNTATVRETEAESLASRIAGTLRVRGFYLAKLKVEKGIESGNSHMNMG